ncbi:MAG: transglutaminase family protein [Anaerolineaceae bacterium]|nr:transglutaminase family protein [Anaerolineaceae bacterium]
MLLSSNKTIGSTDRKTGRYALFLVSFLVFLLMITSGKGKTASAFSPQAKWPADPGSQIQTSGKLRADLSNAKDGYFLAALTSQSSHKMKMRVQKGDVTLTYDLNLKGSFEVFPFQLGSGHYDILLYENVSGKKYSQAGYLGVEVSLVSEDASFYYPNQYVNYTLVSAAVAKADELCAGKSNMEIYQTLCDFMKTSFLYDYVKAVTVQAGTLPDIDGSFQKKMGVCQDLSAILCCMLRTQGLPARLVIGYADKQYHAWTVTYIDGKEYFFDPTAALNAIANVKDYSVERYY